ncbi:MAG: TonB-dependent receptor [Cytophagales bacterium]|nr:MAG: TonB-dependent receptor [Cytophagales bacterium]
MIRLAYVTFTFLILVRLFAQPTQSIRGTIIDFSSNKPIPYATISVLQTNPIIGNLSDSLGNFTLENTPVGRYDLKVNCIGYEPTIIREVVVSSSKQTFLTILLKENSELLSEIEIRPNINKEQPLNSMATLSARMLSVEEAKRYAGGFDDPARLATAFAGVAGNSGQNGIIVRGNAPKFLQWKMEGVEIPNPNHFGDLQSFGGGLLTAMSSQMLANSDFFTGAFPAEFNNALSGVFDISMRKGNNEKREHTFQAGIIGLDASSEGPFKKGKKSSYLFNYRYSTLSLLAPLLPEGANTIKYQDLSFKLNFPTKKAGTFSVWGIGLIDGANNKAKTDSSKWKYFDDKENNVINAYMGSFGISNKYFFKNNAYVKTTLAATSNRTDWTSQKLNSQMILQPQSNISVANSNFIFSSFINKTFNKKHTNRTGILLTGMRYDILLNKSFQANTPPKEIVNSNGFSTLISAYSSSAINLTSKSMMNIGINGQFFTLNNQYTIEPRLGFRYKLKQNHTFGLAYGLHSRLESLNYYFNNSLTTGETAINKNLDFTKSHHLVLSYDWNITDLVHLKVEPYYQQLFSVPVMANSSFSFLNLTSDWFFAEKLQNTGEGRNYGIDLTIEKYVSKGYYYMLTGSLFESEYKGGDGVWRDTRFNRNYVVNLLVGKEWKMGKSKQNVFSLNTRATFQGGNRYTPTVETASKISKGVVFDESKAFSMQYDPTMNLHFTASYKINKTKSSREIALKILNITGQPDFNGFKYNFIDNTVDKDLATIVIPNLSYKIEF